MVKGFKLKPEARDKFCSNSSPVVWIKKKNGTFRMCADYKVHLNEKIENETYPLPNIETVFWSLEKARYFAKIDLSDAYWQIELDEDAKKMSVINTTSDLFNVNQ